MAMHCKQLVTMVNGILYRVQPILFLCVVTTVPCHCVSMDTRLTHRWLTAMDTQSQERRKGK